jgi:hypothetical protein
MIGFTVQQQKVNELSKVLKGSDKLIRRQLTIAVNATGRKTTSEISKEIATELSTAQKNIKKTIKIKKKASNSEKVPTAIVTQSQTDRIPLRGLSEQGKQKKASHTKSVRPRGERISRVLFRVHDQES